MLTNVQKMITRAKKGVFKPKSYYASKYIFPKAFLSNISSPTPTCFSQANKLPVWRASMADEVTARIRAGTWSLGPPSHDQNVVWCKLVFRVKHKADGTIDKHKSRLIAKGFHQQQGLHFSETFSHIAKPMTIRLILSLAVQFEWYICLLDINNAFLHGDLKEEG